MGGGGWEGGRGEYFGITSAFFILKLDVLPTLIFLNIFVQFLQVEFILTSSAFPQRLLIQITYDSE